jgi:hypothetical protein
MIVKTIMQQCQVFEARVVQVDLLQVVYDDSGAEIGRASSPHTVPFWPDADIDYILGLVNRDLVNLRKWNTLDAADEVRLRAYCAATHTPEVKAAYEAWKQAERAKLPS